MCNQHKKYLGAFLFNSMASLIMIIIKTICNLQPPTIKLRHAQNGGLVQCKIVYIVCAVVVVVVCCSMAAGLPCSALECGLLLSGGCFYCSLVKW